MVFQHEKLDQMRTLTAESYKIYHDMSDVWEEFIMPESQLKSLRHDMNLCYAYFYEKSPRPPMFAVKDLETMHQKISNDKETDQTLQSFEVPISIVTTSATTSHYAQEFVKICNEQPIAQRLELLPKGDERLDKLTHNLDVWNRLYNEPLRTIKNGIHMANFSENVLTMILNFCIDSIQIMERIVKSLESGQAVTIDDMPIPVHVAKNTDKNPATTSKNSPRKKPKMVNTQTMTDGRPKIKQSNRTTMTVSTKQATKLSMTDAISTAVKKTNTDGKKIVSRGINTDAVSFESTTLDDVRHRPISPPVQPLQHHQDPLYEPDSRYLQFVPPFQQPQSQPPPPPQPINLNITVPPEKVTRVVNVETQKTNENIHTKKHEYPGATKLFSSSVQVELNQRHKGARVVGKVLVDTPSLYGIDLLWDPTGARIKDDFRQLCNDGEYQMLKYEISHWKADYYIFAKKCLAEHPKVSSKLLIIFKHNPEVLSYLCHGGHSVNVNSNVLFDAETLNRHTQPEDLIEALLYPNNMMVRLDDETERISKEIAGRLLTKLQNILSMYKTTKKYAAYQDSEEHKAIRAQVAAKLQADAEELARKRAKKARKKAERERMEQVQSGEQAEEREIHQSERGDGYKPELIRVVRRTPPHKPRKPDGKEQEVPFDGAVPEKPKEGKKEPRENIPFDGAVPEGYEEDPREEPKQPKEKIHESKEDNETNNNELKPNDSDAQNEKQDTNQKQNDSNVKDIHDIETKLPGSEETQERGPTEQTVPNEDNTEKEGPSSSRLPTIEEKGESGTKRPKKKKVVEREISM